MIQMLCTENLDEILMYPEEYVTNEQDLVLYRVCDKDNDYIVMLGVDNDDDFYFVVDDNEVKESAKDLLFMCIGMAVMTAYWHLHSIAS